MTLAPRKSFAEAGTFTHCTFMRLAALLALSLSTSAAAQQATSTATSPSPSTGVRYGRLLIRNIMVVDGAGNPARGPMDIVVEGSIIASIRPARPINEFGTTAPGAAPRVPAGFDRVIDATGMYVTPGIIEIGRAHV